MRYRLLDLERDFKVTSTDLRKNLSFSLNVWDNNIQEGEAFSVVSLYLDVGEK
jgi:hypothetical protein